MCPPHLFNQKEQASSTKLHISPKISVFGWFLPQAIRIPIQNQFTLKGGTCLISHLLHIIRKKSINMKGNLLREGSQNLLSKQVDLKEKR